MLQRQYCFRTGNAGDGRRRLVSGDRVELLCGHDDGCFYANIRNGQ